MLGLYLPLAPLHQHPPKPKVFCQFLSHDSDKVNTSPSALVKHWKKRKWWCNLKGTLDIPIWIIQDHDWNSWNWGSFEYVHCWFNWDSNLVETCGNNDVPKGGNLKAITSVKDSGCLLKHLWENKFEKKKLFMEEICYGNLVRILGNVDFLYNIDDSIMYPLSIVILRFHSWLESICWR